MQSGLPEQLEEQQSDIWVIIKMNARIRLFQDKLVDLVNEFDDIPWEARLITLELITFKVQKTADDAIMSELSGGNEQCKNPIPE